MRLALIAGSIGCALTLAQPAPTALNSILDNRIVESKKVVGFVVATLDANGPKIAARGRVSADRDVTPDGNTVFEIGSITKVFTSLVLAEMTERGEVSPDDPVEKYLPPGSKMPTRNGLPVTLLDLSMQVSGLPRLPANLSPKDLTNPYASYDGKQLLDFLGRAQLASDPGEKYAYSNLGAGLLGFALASRAGLSYEALVRKYVLEPLGMKDTAVTLSAGQRDRFARGHNAALAPVSPWDFDALAGAGALRSTANDMLKFLGAAMVLSDTRLKPAFERLLAARKPTGTPDLDIAMGWHIWRKFGSTVVWHNGGTGGFRSFIGFNPETRRGVVVLSNTFFDSDDLGLHLVDDRYPVKRYDAPKPELRLDPKLLESYAGEYELAPGFTIVVTREDARLYVQATNQPRFEIFADKENEFFLKVVEARMTFVKDASGRAASLVLHQGGRDTPGKRIR